MRVHIFAAVLCTAVVLCAQTVARVGDREISEDELQLEMELLAENSTYTTNQLRQAALQQLISDELLARYGAETGITVSGDEVESYFISLYGQHPKFQTNGRFDRAKFDRLKRTPEIQAIMADLRRELLVDKTRAMVESRFSISDNDLLESYILDHFRFDIGYAVIDERYVDTAATPQQATDWWQRHKNEFTTPERIRLDVLLVPDDAVNVIVSDEELYSAYYDSGIYRPFEEVRDSLLLALKTERRHQQAYAQAQTERDALQRGGQAMRPLLRSPWLERGDKLGHIPADVLKQAFGMRPQRWTDVMEIAGGWMACCVAERQDAATATFAQAGPQIWQRYLRSLYGSADETRLREYYHANLDSFMVPAASVTMVTIDPGAITVNETYGEGAMRKYYNAHTFTAQGRKLSFDEARAQVSAAMANDARMQQVEELRRQVQAALRNPAELDRLAAQWHLAVQQRLLLLQRYDNGDETANAVAAEIGRNRSQETGEKQLDDVWVLWCVHTMHPEYIPDFETVRDQIPFELPSAQLDEDDFDYAAYYTQNRSNFITPDSLALCGAIVPILPDTASVSDAEITRYYNAHQQEFYTSPRILFDFFYLADPDGRYADYVADIADQVKGGVPLAQLQRMFGSPCALRQNEPMALADMPSAVAEVLERARSAEPTEPLYSDGGWYVLRRIADYPARQLSLDEARPGIARKLALEEAHTRAHDEARRIFERSRNFAACTQVTDSLYLFETPLRAVSDDYPPLGNIMPYAKKLAQLRVGEKYSYVVDTDSACVVVFLKGKVESRQMTLDEAMPIMRRAHMDERRQQRARERLQEMVGRIRNGADPQQLLACYGYWREMRDCTLDSDLPGVPYSRLIVADIPDRREGECSAPVRVGDNQFLIYRIKRLHKVQREDFDRDRDDYRQELRQDAFERWLRDYRTQVGVEVY